MHMTKPLTWLSPSDPTFPSNLAKDVGEKILKRIAALGNLAILHSKPLALICSVKCPGNLILQTYDVAKGLRKAKVPVIGGFHSPMEHECLRISPTWHSADYFLPGQKLGWDAATQRIQETSGSRPSAPPLTIS